MRPTVGMLVFALMAAIAACSASAPVSFVSDAEIDPGVRSELDRLTEIALGAIRAGDPSQLEDQAAPGLLHDWRFQEALIQAGPVLENTTPELMHRFDLSVGNPPRPDVEIPVNEHLSIRLRADAERTAVTLMTVTVGDDQHVLGLVHVGGPGAWSLQRVAFGILGVAGQTAGDWYARASELDRGGYELAGILRMGVAGRCMNPLPFLHYDFEREASTMFRKMRKNLMDSAPFPVRIDRADTHPIVSGIEPAFEGGKLVPHVWYVTRVSLDDTDALLTEAELMHDELLGLYPDMCHEATLTSYKAFSEPPTDPDKFYKTVDVTLDCPPIH